MRLATLLAELKGKSIEEIKQRIMSEELLKTILERDCYYCLKRKCCKNPNAKRQQLTLGTYFYTCAVYEFGIIKTEQKPKKPQPHFNAERIAGLKWALKVIGCKR